MKRHFACSRAFCWMRMQNIRSPTIRIRIKWPWNTLCMPAGSYLRKRMKIIWQYSLWSGNCWGQRSMRPLLQDMRKRRRKLRQKPVCCLKNHLHLIRIRSVWMPGNQSRWQIPIMCFPIIRWNKKVKESRWRKTKTAWPSVRRKRQLIRERSSISWSRKDTRELRSCILLRHRRMWFLSRYRIKETWVLKLRWITMEIWKLPSRMKTGTWWRTLRLSFQQTRIWAIQSVLIRRDVTVQCFSISCLAVPIMWKKSRFQIIWSWIQPFMRSLSKKTKQRCLRRWISGRKGKYCFEKRTRIAENSWQERFTAFMMQRQTRKSWGWRLCQKGMQSVRTSVSVHIM